VNVAPRAIGWLDRFVVPREHCLMGDSTERDHTAIPTVVEAPLAGATPNELATGARLGRYIVLERIGRGGMGVVYAAYDPDLDRKVAVKLLRAGAGLGSAGSAWLLREAQAMAALAHPNVAAVYDVGTIDEQLFLAMELLEGSLKRWLQHDHGWREVMARFLEAARGLEAAHTAGIVHRDFKPDNVLLTKDGHAKVTDFGLARADPVADSGTSHAGLLGSPMTVAGEVMGTPMFMSPEQLRGETGDARSDQFAWCVSLHLALYKVDPFGVTGDERLEAIAANKLCEPSPGPVPAWVHRALVRGLRANAAERWPDMATLIAMLDRDPATARRRIALAAGLAVAVGGIAAAYSLAPHASAQPCTGADAKLAGAWDGDARGAVEAAFLESHAPGATDALHDTERELDGYAHGWVAMRTEACEATRIRGDQSEDILTLRTECLDSRLVELRAFVRELATSDDNMVTHAAAGAHALSALAGCADVAALRTPDRLPVDPITRARVLALRDKLAEGRGLVQASHYKEALALAKPAVAEAAQLGHRPTQARALLLAGESEWFLSHMDKAEVDLTEAELAAEAGKDDGAKFDAWLYLTTHAVHASKFDLAMQRSRQAKATLERLGEPWLQKAELLRTMTQLYGLNGQLPESLAAAQEQRKLVEREQGKTTLEYATALKAEADALGQLGRNTEALDRFREVLAIREQQLGPKHGALADVLTNLAIVEYYLGQPEQSGQYARRALAITEVVYGKDSPENSVALTMIGTALIAQRDYASALATFQRSVQAVERSVGRDDVSLADPLANIGSMLVELKRPGEAIAYVERAVAIATSKLGAENPDTAQLLVSQCDVLRAAGQLDAAIASGRHALAIQEKAYGPTSSRLFDALSALGRTLLAAKQPHEASGLLDRALAAPGGDPSSLPEVELAAARAAWGARPDHQKAVALGRKARDDYDKLGARWAPERGEVEAWLQNPSCGCPK
jgi:eukaryotic-like serine/threonine-protein kinase